MTVEATLTLENVRKCSSYLSRLFKILLWLTAATFIVQTVLILIGDETFGYVRIGLTEYSGGSVPAAAQVIAWINSLAVLGIFLKLNLHLARLFDHYAEGKIFGRENVHQIQQIGITVMLFPILWILVAIAPAFIPVDGRTALMEYDGAGPLPEVLLGAIILVVSWIIDLGRELREEQDLWI
jgi:hypothetical protein